MQLVENKTISVPQNLSSLFKSTPQDTVDRLLFTLDTFQKNLKFHNFDPRPTPPLIVPQALLSRSLTESEKQQVNLLLTNTYASEAVHAQQQIAQVPINENFDNFVYLPDYFSRNSNLKVAFSVSPYHSACGEWAGKSRLFWVRSRFAHRLNLYFQELNQLGFVPKIEDAFRPPGVQEGLFKRRYHNTKQEHPNWDHEKIVVESMSKTAVTPRLASHKGGAAVDFILCNPELHPVDVGNVYSEGGAIVKINCPFITPDQWFYRQLFAKTSELVGLNLYPWEDWHVSYHDNLSGFDPETLTRRPEVVADYGPVKQFDLINGKIISTYLSAELDNTFPHL